MCSYSQHFWLKFWLDIHKNVDLLYLIIHGNSGTGCILKGQDALSMMNFSSKKWCTYSGKIDNSDYSLFYTDSDFIWDTILSRKMVKTYVWIVYNMINNSVSVICQVLMCNLHTVYTLCYSLWSWQPESSECRLESSLLMTLTVHVFLQLMCFRPVDAWWSIEMLVQILLIIPVENVFLSKQYLMDE